MADTRIKINSIVENQLPLFVRDEYPLVAEFLSQYYKSLDAKGGVSDILQNIDQYVKLENLTNLTDSTVLINDIDSLGDVIEVESTYGFPDSYGLIQIDSEIITYTGITTNQFVGCARGFSGITTYQGNTNLDQLIFSQSGIATHASGSTVSNLSIRFLKDFFNKIKKQVVPGFEGREFYENLNEELFITNSKDFYTSKGTDQSYKILFKALYGVDVEVIKPKDYLIEPSNAQYRVVRNLVVESLEGEDLSELLNRTIYQEQGDLYNGANGVVNNIEKILRDGKEYYVLSLDYDYQKDIGLNGSIFGEFSIHPRTKILNNVSIGATFIDVDSTVSFPTEAILYTKLDNGTTVSIGYSGKSLTQLYNCYGIDQNIPAGSDLNVDAYAYGYGKNNQIIKFRVTGVLSDLDIIDNTYYFAKNDTVRIKTLGYDSKKFRDNNWIFNICPSYTIKSLDLIDSTDYTYRLATIDQNIFNIGDILELLLTDGSIIKTTIYSIENRNSCIIKGQGLIPPTNLIVNVKKSLSRVNSTNQPELSLYTTNIQNVYTDLDSTFVTSPSLPTYHEEPLNINDLSVTFSGSFSGEELRIVRHGFYTGEAIWYNESDENNRLDILNGIYYVKKIDEDTIKLSKSRSNIDNNKFVSVNGTVVNNKFEYYKFNSQKVEPQKIIRKISDPEDDGNIYETLPGAIGILVNGVEVLNYKSSDSIFYGELEEIIVSGGGYDYDVVNPPILQITDKIGVGATGFCSVVGTLERIDIIDPGFDYISEPIITISGLNGQEATAKATLTSFEHYVDFNSSSNANMVDLSNNTIAFSTYHKFRDSERVIYRTDKQQSVGGLTTDSQYYVYVEDAYTVKLHKTQNDAIIGINTVNLTSYGIGNHRFRSYSPKNRIGFINILNAGYNFTNRKISVTRSGINTYSNEISAKNHGYNEGDIITYESINPIGGLSTSKKYFVSKIDDDKFKLSEVGIGSTLSRYFYETNQFVNLTSNNDDNHYFNYPPIEILINGVIGVSTKSGQDFNAKIRPIILGEIKSVFLDSGGVGYGCSDIIGYNRQPQITLVNGDGAEITPIVSNGKIVDVLVNNSGANYNSTPEIIYYGDGYSSLMTPIINDGKLTEVKVINGGVGFNTSNTTAIVLSRGQEAKFEAKIKEWTINLFEKLYQNNKISNDDGIVDSGLNSDYGLQYTHIYSPRSLRKTLLSSRFVDGNLNYTPDLILINDKEVKSSSHSPIIGWAYDGNPIYGPYGFTKVGSRSGTVKQMISGYEIIQNLPTTRPSLDLYPKGFFVQDYEFKAKGDLDEYNGRWCITPEYPNGVYAYFSTINSDTVESSGVFKNYKKPEFPYLIGNKFRSKPIEYNFTRYANQDSIDLSGTYWFRNTTPYGLTNENTFYDYLIKPSNIQNQTSKIKFATKGAVESVGIVSGGINYNVGDLVVFDNTETGGRGASARVSLVKGNEIQEISCSTNKIENIEFSPYLTLGSFIGFSSLPHGFKNSDYVYITGINTTTTSLKNLYEVGVRSETFKLISGIGSAAATGIVTYFNISGSLIYPNIRENDVLGIGTEKVKVLSVDIKSSRIKVLRQYDNTVGSAHTSLTPLYENSRKFTINVGYNTSNQYRVNREIYFNPSESLGIGITGTYTAYISNPGSGSSTVTIPVRSIYYENHGLETGDRLVYFSNGGTPVSVSTNGSSSFQLLDNQIVYSVRINNDLIGISTLKVGVGSTGTYVGIDSSKPTSILYFTGIGTGTIHSFRTNYDNVVIGSGIKNIVTISTASTHGLNIKDSVYINSSPGISTTIVVKYNDYNRRLIVNPRSFVSSDVDIVNDIITINNHGYNNGQKIIHTSTSPCTGLTNEQIYYAVVLDENKIKLSENYYESVSSKPSIVSIGSSSFGTLSPINPELAILKGSSVIFDLSDSSLSYSKNSTLYPAFELNFYLDKNFKNKFETSQLSNEFEIYREGVVGIDPTANVKINATQNFPQTIYYKLDVVNIDNIPVEKSQIIIDAEYIKEGNTIYRYESEYTGTYKISGIGSTTFSFSMPTVPEKNIYRKNEGLFEYYTDSKTSYGEIYALDVDTTGSQYEKLPGISTIVSEKGTGAVLLPYSSSIGQVKTSIINDIGYDYYADTTIRPLAKLPEILKISTLTSFEKIGITSAGINYAVSPDLLVIDGLTRKIVDDVDLFYKVGDTEVTILKNTTGISNVPPIIIPVNNCNGVGISSIGYNPLTNYVTVGLAVSYSNASDFPFSVGDKVLIENISVGLGSTGRGYNSSQYSYGLFPVVAVSPNIGGINATVTYDLTEYISSGQVPGRYDPINSKGRIIPEKHFPKFDAILSKNNFIKGETVVSDDSIGIVENWDQKNEILKVSTNKEFYTNTVLRGLSSKSQGLISNKESFEATYEIDSSSIVTKGWERQTGFLNSSLQKIHDNDYYQYFSYSLKSEIPYETWNTPVSNLNHVVGYKKFSDLVIETRDLDYVGIQTSQDNGDFYGICDFSSTINLNHIYDYDLVFEETINNDNNIISTDIVFTSKEIQDYLQSIGNRVLEIDDFSDTFKSVPRSTPFSIVDTFRMNDSRSRKYITYVRDKRFSSDRQILLVSLLYDNDFGYLNQYGRVESYLEDLGSFDFTVNGDEGNLLFYPSKYTVNDYNISLLSFNLKDDVTATSTSYFGDIIRLSTSNVNASSSTPSTIVSIASTYRSTKILVQIESNNDIYEYDELTAIHDGTNVDLLEYGQITNHSRNAYASSGLGTYNAYLSGPGLIVEFIPNPGVAATINTMAISFAANTSGSVGTGTAILSTSSLSSNYVSIASTSAPTQNLVSSYSSDYSGAYYIASVEDTTNSRYQISELVVVDETVFNTTSITEFGIVETHSGLGTFGSDISGNQTNLYFTPNPNINAQVRIFQVAMKPLDEGIATNNIDLNNGFIKSNYGSYEGTERDVRRSFELTSSGREIFKRYFDGTDSSVVNITNNTIRIPEHYFVTGEELQYSSPGIGNTQSIGITTAISIPGIGITNKLPGSIYAIKVSDLDIRVAASATDALKAVPIPLQLNSLGIGTVHSFTSKRQNSRVLVTIDNVIQSPIVGSSITTTCAKTVEIVDDRVKFSGITSFFSDDLIMVDDEIMRLNTVGLGSTNIVQVQRGWMGTNIGIHTVGSLIKKILGDYNIVGNTINFFKAPYGKSPIGTDSNRPDDRDYTGITTHSTFSGRSFMRSSATNSTSDPYSKNYIFDDISEGFTGIKSTFTLRSEGKNISGISSDNAVILINQIFQGPQRLGVVDIVGDYTLTENAGITSITFNGSYDPDDITSTNLPFGGQIVSVGSTKGFGYQPLVAAGGTAIVSSAGTISAISIGNSGSGYRSGIQTTVNVGVYTESLTSTNITYVGFASVSNGNIVRVSITNPGIGYTSSNPPKVIFDSPLSYSNIPLVYSTNSTPGFGTGATISIVVGQGSSIIDFEIQNNGYGYGQGEKLTIEYGGSTGIPTDITKNLQPFELSIDRIYNDQFNGWSLGSFQVIDNIDELFDGQVNTFPIKIDGVQQSIRSKKGSNINVESTLLVFINDILQTPGQSYIFEGGSIIKFVEAPRAGDTSKILFYKGTEGVDVVSVDILETVKVGDQLRIYSEDLSLNQTNRLVTRVNSSDSVLTNPYSNIGVSSNRNLLRPVIWCRQTEDVIIDGIQISKNREWYEPLVNPSTNIIQSVGVGSTFIFVESVKSFFDSAKENTSSSIYYTVKLTSQDQKVSAASTAIVSIAGTISSINITSGGIGYSTNPTVTIANPVGLGTTLRASANAFISAGVVTSIQINYGGIGYTTTNPPVVLIEDPEPISEIIEYVSYEGDFGRIVGVATTSVVGVASTAIAFDFYIPQNSILRNSSIVGTAITISGISTGYYFVVNKSNVGNGVTSLRRDKSIVGVGTEFLDNVYEVISVSNVTRSIPGIGVTYVSRVITSVSSYNGLTGIANTGYYGNYSWGKVSTNSRTNPTAFNSYNNNGTTGLSTNPILIRLNPLRYFNYNS